MLTPVRMRKVTVIVSRSELTNFLEYAGQQGLLHLISIPEKEIPIGTSQLETASTLARSANIRNRLNTIGSSLKSSGGLSQHVDEKLEFPPMRDIGQLTEFLDKETQSLEHQVKQFEAESETLQADLSRYLQLSRLLTGLEQLGVRLSSLGGEGGFTNILAGECPRDSTENIRDELDRITYGNSIFVITSTSDIEGPQGFFAVLPAAFQDEARQSIAALGARVETGLEGLPQDPSVARKQVDQKLEEIREAQKILQSNRESLAKESISRYQSFVGLSEILDLRAKALSSALATESTVLLQAWIPDGHLERFTEGAMVACPGGVSVQVDERAGERAAKRAHEHSKELTPETITELESPPTLVETPGWLIPLQKIINNFGSPSYHELNPLPFMIVTYPIIYGLMFGDVGQGLLFIVGGLFLWNLKRKGRKIFELGQLIADGAELLVMLGVGIVVFGVIFGDFFGFEPDFLKLRIVDGVAAPIFSPSELKIEFMVVTLFIGVIHLAFGLSLSAANKIRNKEYAHALFGPIAWIVFYLSSVFLISEVVLAGFKFGVTLKPPLVFVFAPVVGSLAVMAWKEGGLHMFEAFLSSASNTLSYLRIWALNIADFEFKFALFTAGGILGAVLGNFLVLIIEGLIVFVQTLRLHWVEWFSKFYEGTGVTFAPYREPLAIPRVSMAKQWSNQ